MTVHESELSAVCSKGDGKPGSDTGKGRDRGEECVAKITELCGCSKESADGRACMSQCMTVHESELSALTSLFGMERGEPHCNNHLRVICNLSTICRVVTVFSPLGLNNILTY